jgi:hypothetical protein
VDARQCTHPPSARSPDGQALPSGHGVRDRLGGHLGWSQTVQRRETGWHQPGRPVDANVGPVHLVFDNGRSLLLAGRSDWTLGVSEADDGDRGGLAAYHYEHDGGR